MKTKALLPFLLALLLCSCRSPRYLPDSGGIDVNEYGSYIRVVSRSNIIKGELIAIESDNLVVLTSSTRNCVIVPVKDISKFRLRYARPKHYGWTIPITVLVPVIHGMLSIFTIPLNLVVTSAVTISGETAFTYTRKDMDYHKLKMFARFPQGIPPNVDIGSIQ